MTIALAKPPSTDQEWVNLFSHISSLVHDSPPPDVQSAPKPQPEEKLPPAAREDLASLIDHTLLSPTATADQISQLCAEARRHRFRTVCVRANYVGLARRELGAGGDVSSSSSLREKSEETEKDQIGIGIASVIGFPTDGHAAPRSSTEEKVSEAKAAVAEGATELDMVMDYEGLLRCCGDLEPDPKPQQSGCDGGGFSAIYTDIRSVRESIPESASTPILLKVILETSQLNPDPDPDPDLTSATPNSNESNGSDNPILRATVISCLAGAEFVKTSTGFRARAHVSAMCG